MTEQAQRIAIATWLGWRPRGEPVPSMTLPYDEPIQWWAKDGAEDTTVLPDYTGDLNAMHEAEKHLSADDWPHYRLKLVEACCNSPVPEWQCYAITATAGQRAWALLHTLGLWASITEDA